MALAVEREDRHVIRRLQPAFVEELRTIKPVVTVQRRLVVDVDEQDVVIATAPVGLDRMRRTDTNMRVLTKEGLARKREIWVPAPSPLVARVGE